MYVSTEALLARLNSQENFANRHNGGASVELDPTQNEDSLDLGGEECNETLSAGQSLSEVNGDPVSIVKRIGTKPGSRRGIKNLTPEERVEIAAYARIYGPAAAADKYNVSYNRAETLNRGIVSAQLGSPQDLRNGIQKRLEPIRETAMTKVLEAMGLLTMSKLEDLKGTELADVAAKMVRVVEKTTPVTLQSETQGQIVFYTPKINEEDEYPEMEVASA